MSATPRIFRESNAVTTAAKGVPQRIEEIPEPDLVGLVRSGNREAGAEFLRRNHDVLRQRIRRRIRRVGRRLFDSQEILSTVVRRLDRMVSLGTVQALNPAALMGLLVQIAERSVVDKARVVDRIRRVEGEDSALADEMRKRLSEGDRAGPDAGEDVIAQVFEGLGGPREREILALWLRGCPLRSIAEQMGTQADTMRQQWAKIRKRCLVVLTGEESK